MTDLDCASDWLKKISLVVRPIRITIQIWVVTHFWSHFPGVISRGVTSHCDGGAKCRLFSQADMDLRSPFCISSDPCRIKVLLAKRYPHSLQTTPCYAWHRFKSTLLTDSWEICCWTSTLQSKALFASLSLARHPLGHSLWWPIRGGSARKGYFFRLQLYERVGKSLIWDCKRAQKG